MRQVLLAVAVLLTSLSAAASSVIDVYKSPTWGCCSGWVSHLKENGFEVIEHDVQSVHPFKKKAGLDSRLASCHTAFVDGKFIEGHVPASDIKRMLKLKNVKGLAVPGMPAKSPGMARPGEKIEGFKVYAIDQDDGIKVFSSH